MSASAEEEELPDIDDVPFNADTSDPPILTRKLDAQSSTTLEAELNRERRHYEDDDLPRTDTSSTESSSETENEMRNLSESDASEIRQSEVPSPMDMQAQGSVEGRNKFVESSLTNNGNNFFGVKDNDGFLPPPPASTLLIRRTRTSSTGASTYVVSAVNPPHTSPDAANRSYSKDPYGENGCDTDLPSFEPREVAEDEDGRRTGKGKLIRKPGRPFGSLGRKSLLPGVNKFQGIGKRGPGRPPLNPASGVLAKKKYKRRGRRWSFPFHRQHSKIPHSSLKAGSRYSIDNVEEEIDDNGQRRRKSLTWRPVDDFRLIVNVLQTHDLKQVHMGVKFSCHFTLEVIRNRWRALLYNELISKVALTACRNLHSKIKMSVYADALFSSKELQVLQGVKSTSNPTINTFQSLLRHHILTFHHGRTPKSLQKCWLELKELQMLDDQNIKSYFEGGRENFSDFENSINDDELLNFAIDPVVLNEVLVQERKNKKRIRMLEQEIATWQVLSDLVLEGQVVKPAETDDTTYALIRGKNVRFIMAAKEITLGRRTHDNWVDADLSDEGCDGKISRRQAIIKMRALGDFVILNQGRHPMYIDGRALLPGEVTTLQDQSVIRVSQLNFVFIVNEKLLKEHQLKIIEEESNAEHIDVESLQKKSEAKAPKNLLPRFTELDTSIPTFAVPPVFKPMKPDGAQASPRKRKSSTTLASSAYSAASPPVVTEASNMQPFEEPIKDVKPPKKPVRKPKQPKSDAKPRSQGKNSAPRKSIPTGPPVNYFSYNTTPTPPPPITTNPSILTTFSNPSVSSTPGPNSFGLSTVSAPITPAFSMPVTNFSAPVPISSSISGMNMNASTIISRPPPPYPQPIPRSTVPLPSFATFKSLPYSLPPGHNMGGYSSSLPPFIPTPPPPLPPPVVSDVGAMSFPKLSEILSKPPAAPPNYQNSVFQNNPPSGSMPLGYAPTNNFP